MHDPAKARILLVDDEPDILASLEDLFQAEMPEVHVQSVLSGHEALEALAQDAYAVIISDYKMPGMDGLELLRKVRHEAPSILRVLMTAFPDLTIALDAINEASVENFFVKPLEPDEIIAQIRDMLAERDAETQRNRAFARALQMQRHTRAPQEAPDE